MISGTTDCDDWGSGGRLTKRSHLLLKSGRIRQEYVYCCTDRAR